MRTSLETSQICLNRNLAWIADFGDTLVTIWKRFYELYFFVKNFWKICLNFVRVTMYIVLKRLQVCSFPLSRSSLAGFPVVPVEV